jgi:Zn-dependent M28 family amino/carboxypeptidase
MSVRMRAALGGALLALAAAPAAEAQKQKQEKLGDFRMVRAQATPTTVVAGDTVRVSGRVQNRKGRRAQTARVTYTLFRSRTGRSLGRLGGDNVKRTKGGRSRSFSELLRIPAGTPAGTYFIRVCVRRGSGTLKAECKFVRITVTARPVPPPPPPPVDNRTPSEKLRAAITKDGMLAHLRALQEVADHNGGTRASGFQGYGGSVHYVVDVLRAAGYNPTTQVFDFVVFTENGTPTFQRTAPPPTRNYVHETEFATMNYSGSGDSEAPMTAVDVNLDPTPANRTSDSGCEDADFAGFPAGDIALVQRGTCTFYEKALNAQEAGASAVVVFNQGNDPGRSGVVAGTLGEEAQDGSNAEPDITIPALGTSYAIGEELANEDSNGTPDDVRLNVVVDATNDRRKSTNVLAETADGNANRVVMMGGHLDSVQEGPGINDNGSGSAFVLEMAVQMSKLGIKPANKMRFAWWGAEESGLVGATRYMAALSDEAFGRLAAYLNFDMLASPNHGKFVYDGDFSDSTPPATAPAVNPGAARIESEFVNYFNSQNIPTEPTAFDGRSDYKPFQDNGVASGGLFSGAEVAKSAAQAAKWGGTAGMAFDPNYHQAGDNINNLDMNGGEQLADGGAHVGITLGNDAALRNVNGGMAAPGFRQSSRADGKASDWLGRRLQR